MAKRGTFEGLWQRIDHVGRSPNECWLYKGGLNSQGYGKLNIDGKYWTAHRAAWHSRRFPIPKSLWVLHLCRNRHCCNPDHLYLGTPADNMHDRDRDNATARGILHGRAKLTVAQVLAIRTDPRSGPQIAAAYGINHRQVARIKAGIQWRHI